MGPWIRRHIIAKARNRVPIEFYSALNILPAESGVALIPVPPSLPVSIARTPRRPASWMRRERDKHDWDEVMMASYAQMIAAHWYVEGWYKTHACPREALCLGVGKNIPEPGAALEKFSLNPHLSIQWANGESGDELHTVTMRKFRVVMASQHSLPQRTPNMDIVHMLILRTLQGEAHRILEEALGHYDHQDDGIPEYNTAVEVSS
ncbi:hypothetical protein EDD85DRAFT_786443 [Armillaria nabsnona]|nr:hypothetical protein EDD85DRAFT_786443 [Armillaria nabsnona]